MIYFVLITCSSLWLVLMSLPEICCYHDQCLTHKGCGVRSTCNIIVDPETKQRYTRCKCSKGLASSSGDQTNCTASCQRKKGCGEHALCKNGACQCIDGFISRTRNGKTCVSCVLDADCGVNSKCLHHGLDASFCHCDHGYVSEIGRHGKNCHQAGCWEHSDCGPHSICQRGQCRCMQGYSTSVHHDGKHCHLACNSSAICGIKSSCTHGICTCKEGLTSLTHDGTHCSAFCVDSKQCGSNSHCIGGHCLCFPDYFSPHGNHVDCLQCMTSSDCGPNTACNTSNHECMCMHGYVPHPSQNRTCVECLSAADCGAHAFCHHHTCFCHPEYTFASNHSRNCNVKCHGSAVICGSRSSCFNSQICVCDKGLVSMSMDGRNCAAPCSSGYECGSHSLCTNDTLVSGCRCHSNTLSLSGDGLNCTSLHVRSLKSDKSLSYVVVGIALWSLIIYFSCRPAAAPRVRTNTYDVTIQSIYE